MWQKNSYFLTEIVTNKIVNLKDFDNLDLGICKKIFFVVEIFRVIFLRKELF